jgi:hypothetical protein
MSDLQERAGTRRCTLMFPVRSGLPWCLPLLVSALLAGCSGDQKTLGGSRPRNDGKGVATQATSGAKSRTESAGHPSGTTEVQAKEIAKKYIAPGGRLADISARRTTNFKPHGAIWSVLVSYYTLSEDGKKQMADGDDITLYIDAKGKIVDSFTGL